MIDPENYLAAQWSIHRDDTKALISDAVKAQSDRFKAMGMPRSGGAIKAVYRAVAVVIGNLVNLKVEPFLALSPSDNDKQVVKAELDLILRHARSCVATYANFANGYDGDARIAVDKMLDLLQTRLDLPFFEPGAKSEPDADHSAPRRPRTEALQELADTLDREGKAIRFVNKDAVKERWHAEDGPVPKVTAVTTLMRGAGKGGAPRKKPLR